MLGINNVRLAIIGNKLDLLSPSEQRNPLSNPIVEEAIEFAEGLQNARHYLTSAKLNLNVAELFSNLARRMIEQSKRIQAQPGIPTNRNQLRGFQGTLSVSCESVDDDLRVVDSLRGTHLASRGRKRQPERSCQCRR